MDQAEEPFQPVGLHPGRSHFFVPGMEVKSRPYTYLERIEGLPMFVCKFLLPRAPQADKNEAGATLVNPFA